MNGFELVRLQPKQVLKTGDTMTGDLTMKNSKVKLDKAILQNSPNDDNTLQVIGTTNQTMGAIKLGTGGCRVYALGNNDRLVVEGGIFTNKTIETHDDCKVLGRVEVGNVLNQGSDSVIEGHNGNITFKPSPSAGWVGGMKLRWTGVNNPSGATNNARFELIPTHNNDIRLGSPANRFHTAYVGVIDFNGGTGIYPLGQHNLTFKCSRPQGGQEGELFYSHNGTAYHFEPKWSGDVATVESTGLGRSARTWRDVWTHLGHHQTSDITKKENIQKIVSDEEIAKSKKTKDIKDISLLSSNSIAETVKQIQPITFDYKGMVKTLDDGTIAEDDEISKSARQLGISAQDLEALNPALFEYIGNKITVENEDGDLETNYSIKTLAYTNMLLVALQETMKKVEALEKEIVELKSKI